MRYLSIVFLLVFSLTAAGQSPALSKVFSEGTKYAGEQRFQDALESYKTALQMADNEYAGASFRAKLHYNIGVCYLRLDQFNSASNEFKRALLLDSSFAPAHYALGIVRSRKAVMKSATAYVKTQ
jgi:tetratricopeptide (TPR) repeat protein